MVGMDNVQCVWFDRAINGPIVRRGDVAYDSGSGDIGPAVKEQVVVEVSVNFDHEGIGAMGPIVSGYVGPAVKDPVVAEVGV